MEGARRGEQSGPRDLGPGTASLTSEVFSVSHGTFVSRPGGKGHTSQGCQENLEETMCMVGAP